MREMANPYSWNRQIRSISSKKKYEIVPKPLFHDLLSRNNQTKNKSHSCNIDIKLVKNFF